MQRRMVISALAALALAFASVGVAGTPVEAKWVDGWYTFYGQETKTRTFYERSPLKTRLVIRMQKKRGADAACGLRVWIDKGRWEGWTRWYTKDSREAFDVYRSFWDWEGDLSKRTKVKVKTNGNCLYRVWLK